MVIAFRQLGLIGCGLMGCSFALAAKRAGLVEHVVGYSRSPASTAQAQHIGAVDATANSAQQAASGADLVLLAIPVATTACTLESIRPLLGANTLVMDVGSVKASVVEAAQKTLGEEQIARFVPAHPIAGKEKAGAAAATADLYRHRQVVLTPTQQTSAEAVHLASALWMALGSKVRLMSPQTHDSIFATVSHLPHLLAFALMHSIAQQPDSAQVLSLAGPGFRDFTRIAASSPEVWRDILVGNQAEVLAQLQQFRQALDTYEAQIRTGDSRALETLIAQASQRRAHWGDMFEKLSCTATE